MDIGKSHRVTDQGQTVSFVRCVKPSSQWMQAWVAIVLLLSGCTMVGPDFVKPEAPLLDEWQETQAPGLSVDQTDYSTWWSVFEDPVLDNLIEKAHQQNLSLQIAGIRIYEARAQLGIAVGNLYPQQQSASGGLTTNKRSGSTDIPFTDTNFNELSLGFDAAWELDIWGKFRRSVQSGVANLEASVASYDDVLVSLTAEVARRVQRPDERLELALDGVSPCVGHRHGRGRRSWWRRIGRRCGACWRTSLEIVSWSKPMPPT